MAEHMRRRILNSEQCHTQKPFECTISSHLTSAYNIFRCYICIKRKDGGNLPAHRQGLIELTRVHFLSIIHMYFLFFKFYINTMTWVKNQHIQRQSVNKECLLKRQTAYFSMVYKSMPSGSD